LIKSGVKKIRLPSLKLEPLMAIKSIIPDAQVVVTITNHLVTQLATDFSAAVAAMQPLADYTSVISHIAVSNEPETAFTAGELSTVLIPAVNNIRGALVQLNLPIKLTIPFSMSILGTDFPPSKASLKVDLLPQLQSLLQVCMHRHSIKQRIT